MRRSFTLLLTCAALLWSTSCIAAPGELGDSGGFNSNPHNLSSRSGNAKEANTETQICIFCHTPHGATPQTTLWSRPDPTGPVGGFQIRAGLGISDAGAGGFDDSHYGDTSSGYEYPNGTSKLCLSCHDGVTAIGTLSNGTMIDMVGGNALEINLTTSHPVSFIYNLAVKNHLGATYTLPTDPSYLDGSFRVQCTSCHQPHQDTMATNSLPFWRDMTTIDPDTAYDNVCIQCHTTDYLYSAFDDHNF